MFAMAWRATADTLWQGTFSSSRGGDALSASCTAMRSRGSSNDATTPIYGGAQAMG
jgi:hypothetical protein